MQVPKKRIRTSANERTISRAICIRLQFPNHDWWGKNQKRRNVYMVSIDIIIFMVVCILILFVVLTHDWWGKNKNLLSYRYK